MAHRHLDFLFSKSHATNWCLMSFLAGSVNVGGYMACHRFVTHLTGFATLFGRDMAQGDWLIALSMLTVPLFFLAGTMMSAWLTERRLHKGKKPLYTVAIGLVITCLFLAGFGGYLGWFGKFGDDLAIKSDYVFLALLCTASGLQNAIVTSYTGALVRTTHLTGMTTDLGIGLIRVIFPAHNEGKLVHERRLNKLRLGLIGSFIAGSTLGALLFAKFQYLGFLLPTGLAIYALFASIYVWQTPKFLKEDALIKM